MTPQKKGVLRFFVSFILYKVILYTAINRARKWSKTL